MGHTKDLRQCRAAGERLRRERERIGLSVRHCAVLLGVRAEELLSIEAGNIFVFYRDESRMARMFSDYEELLLIKQEQPHPTSPSTESVTLQDDLNPPIQDVPRFLRRA